MGKTYRDTQLKELVHSVAVEQLPEYELTCGSKPAWERGEGEAVAEQHPPRASNVENQGPTSWRVKCQSGFATLSPEPLRSNQVWFFCGEGV
jgi:hypothetical protein